MEKKNTEILRLFLVVHPTWAASQERPRSGRSPKKPRNCLTGLQSCRAAMGNVAGRTTVSTSLYESRLYGRVAWKRPLHDAEVKAAAWTWQKDTWETLEESRRGRRDCYDERETELSAIKQSSLSGGNWAQLITRLIAPLLCSMVMAVSCCGGAFQQKGLGDL